MGDVEQHALSRSEAQALTSEIQRGMRGLQELIIKAYEGRAWSALGYATWDAYCDGELAGARPELPRDERRELVSELRDAGMSQRAIGSAIGVARSTVQEDLGQVDRNRPVEMSDSMDDVPAPSKDPFTVTGTNGKTYTQKPQKAAVTGPVWSPEQSAMKDAVERGETVVASLRGAHKELIEWAQSNGLYERIDRRSPWGNPFEMPEDGDRKTVIQNYEDHYLPYKPGLLSRLETLRGKVLGCWCAPEPCHGDVLKREAQA
jgi:hypothetical protein